MSEHSVTKEPAPFILDIHRLGRRPGEMTEVHRTVATPERLGVEMIGIPKGSEIDLDLRLESVSEGVLVTGTVSGETEGLCSRCLEPITGTVTVFLTELFAYPDSTTDQTTDAEDVHRIVGERIDLTQPVIDAVGLELPMAPLCAEDCQGLCSVCGVRLAVAEDNHEHELIDPRWAGLAAKLEGLRSESNDSDDPDDPDDSGGPSAGGAGTSRS